MKKTLCFILALIFAFSITGCGTSQSKTASGESKGSKEDDSFRISIPDVSKKTLPEAINELEECGFISISAKTNDPNWSQDRWIVVGQNYPAGERVLPSEDIVLSCTKLCQLYIDVKSEANLIFNKYDIELYIEDEEIGTVANGNGFSKLLSLLEGKYNFIAYKSGDHSVSTKKTITVSGDITFQCDIEHDKSTIGFINIKTLESIEGASLVMIDTTGMVLSEAMDQLSALGFSNVREEPFTDIWNRDNWIIVSQNVNAGEAKDKNTAITLECITLDEYFNNEYKGKNAAEVLSLATDSGFSVKFKDSSGTDQTDRITNAGDKEKADWVVIKASQYSGRIASVVVEFTGVTPEPTEVPTPEPTEVPTPEPTTEPEPEEESTPEPTKAPTAKKYTDSEVKKGIKQLLDTTSIRYDVNLKDTLLEISFYPDGLTNSIYRITELNDSSEKKGWDSLVKSVKKMSESLSEDVREGMGRDDLMVVLECCDDTGNYGNVFLIVSDGVVLYDFVNGIDLLGLNG